MSHVLAEQILLASVRAMVPVLDFDQDCLRSPAFQDSAAVWADTCADVKAWVAMSPDGKLRTQSSTQAGE